MTNIWSRAIPGPEHKSIPGCQSGDRRSETRDSRKYPNREAASVEKDKCLRREIRIKGRSKVARMLLGSLCDSTSMQLAVIRSRAHLTEGNNGFFLSPAVLLSSRSVYVSLFNTVFSRNSELLSAEPRGRWRTAFREPG